MQCDYHRLRDNCFVIASPRMCILCRIRHCCGGFHIEFGGHCERVPHKDWPRQFYDDMQKSYLKCKQHTNSYDAIAIDMTRHIMRIRHSQQWQRKRSKRVFVQANDIRAHWAGPLQRLRVWRLCHDSQRARVQCHCDTHSFLFLIENDGDGRGTKTTCGTTITKNQLFLDRQPFDSCKSFFSVWKQNKKKKENFCFLFLFSFW